ncbi:hypothetical protein BH09PSE2_BH09PSE2_01770 [soil metagenome]
MDRLLLRLRYVFLGLFVLGAAGSWAYQIFYVQPYNKCIIARHWWDKDTRTCATPVSITRFTGRPLPAGAQVAP